MKTPLKDAIEGIPAEYLWSKKQIVPILKVDKGLAAEEGGVQLMKPMPNLSETLASANAHGIFGTKMRSVIKQAAPEGIDAVVAQQFSVGQGILDAGLVPIIEPEVDINCPNKGEAEQLLKAALLKHLDQLPEGVEVMLKLTLPEAENFYSDCINHEKTLRVVALSGGYSREDSNRRLTAQHGMIASFSESAFRRTSRGPIAGRVRCHARQLH